MFNPIAFGVLSCRLNRAYNNKMAIGIQLKGFGINEETVNEFLSYHNDLFKRGDSAYFKEV